MDNYESLHSLAKQVAPLIGYTYDERESRDGERIYWNAHLTGKNGALYIIYATGTNQKRLHIGVSWPTSPTRRVYPVERYRSEFADLTRGITVSADKAPEAIARDIKRRLLPDAEKLYTEAHRQMMSDIEFHGLKRATTNEIAHLLGKEPHERDLDYNSSPSFYFFGTRGTVQINSSTSIKVTLDLNDVSQFRHLLRVLDFSEKAGPSQ